MRLVSQDKTIDVPYENGAVVLGFDGPSSASVIHYYNHYSTRGTKLAEYSSQEKALKAMEMLKEDYSKYRTAQADNYWFAFNDPKVFQFPKDNEIEV